MIHMKIIIFKTNISWAFWLRIGHKKKNNLCVKSDVKFVILGDNFLLLEGRKSIFLSASRSQFVAIQ